MPMMPNCSTTSSLPSSNFMIPSLQYLHGYLPTYSALSISLSLSLSQSKTDFILIGLPNNSLKTITHHSTFNMHRLLLQLLLLRILTSSSTTIYPLLNKTNIFSIMRTHLNHLNIPSHHMTDNPYFDFSSVVVLGRRAPRKHLKCRF